MCVCVSLQEYALVQTHCYGHCLGSLGLRHQEEGRVEEYFQGVEDAATITGAVRAPLQLACMVPSFIGAFQINHAPSIKFLPAS